MTLKLYEQVSLKRDVSADRLSTGDVATLVDLVPGPPGQSQGAVLEVFNAIGETICVTAFAPTTLNPCTPTKSFPSADTPRR